VLRCRSPWKNQVYRFRKLFLIVTRQRACVSQGVSTLERKRQHPSLTFTSNQAAPYINVRWKHTPLRACVVHNAYRSIGLGKTVWFCIMIRSFYENNLFRVTVKGKNGPYTTVASPFCACRGAKVYRDLLSLETAFIRQCIVREQPETCR